MLTIYHPVQSVVGKNYIDVLMMMMVMMEEEKEEKAIVRSAPDGFDNNLPSGPVSGGQECRRTQDNQNISAGQVRPVTRVLHICCMVGVQTTQPEESCLGTSEIWKGASLALLPSLANLILVATTEVDHCSSGPVLLQWTLSFFLATHVQGLLKLCFKYEEHVNNWNALLNQKI